MNISEEERLQRIERLVEEIEKKVGDIWTGVANCEYTLATVWNRLRILELAVRELAGEDDGNVQDV